MSSTLKESKLQIDMRPNKERGLDNELVVLSSEVKDNVRKIASGEAGHGFFEAAVELNDLMGASSTPMNIGTVVRQLSQVSDAFYQHIARSDVGNSTTASYSRLSEPRNSFMIHLKPDTAAAIQRAFDHVTAELDACPGWHRRLHLWELVEGKDWTLCTRFAELVGLMLQNTRMRSGSFAAYVGNSQLIANGHNIRMQLCRLLTQACHYLGRTAKPRFLSDQGRNAYFGGYKRPHSQTEVQRDAQRKASRALGHFGEDGPGPEGPEVPEDPEYGGNSRSTLSRRARFRPGVVRRMRYYSRLREARIHRVVSGGASMPPAVRADFDKLVDAMSHPEQLNGALNASQRDSLHTAYQNMRQNVPLDPASMGTFNAALNQARNEAAANPHGRELTYCASQVDAWQKQGRRHVYALLFQPRTHSPLPFDSTAPLKRTRLASTGTKCAPNWRPRDSAVRREWRASCCPERSSSEARSEAPPFTR